MLHFYFISQILLLFLFLLNELRAILLFVDNATFQRLWTCGDIILVSKNLKMQALISFHGQFSSFLSSLLRRGFPFTRRVSRIRFSLLCQESCQKRCLFVVKDSSFSFYLPECVCMPTFLWVCTSRRNTYKRVYS